MNRATNNGFERYDATKRRPNDVLMAQPTTWAGKMSRTARLYGRPPARAITPPNASVFVIAQTVSAATIATAVPAESVGSGRSSWNTIVASPAASTHCETLNVALIGLLRR